MCSSTRRRLLCIKEVMPKNVVAAGMATGNVGARYGLTPANKIAVESFWEYAVFAANSFVFSSNSVLFFPLGKRPQILRISTFHSSCTTFVYIKLARISSLKKPH